MRTLLSRLAPRDWLIVIGGLALVAGIEMAKPAADRTAPPAPSVAEPTRGPPTLYGEGSRRVVRDIAGMHPEDRAQMDTSLADATYFGAHAVGDGGAYGWSRGFSTQNAAQAAAVATCARYGTGCKVVAEVLPQGADTFPDTSLSWDQTQAYRRTAQGLGVRAFARSLDGTWGIGTGATEPEAAEIAVLNCEGARNVQSDLAPMPCEAIGIWTGNLPPP
jgi:hypothetical protein